MKEKDFDCVAMKEALQRSMREEEERIGADEAARRRRQWIDTSDDPLARWWRSLATLQDVAGSAPVVREDPP